MYELKRSVQFSNLNLTGTHRKLTAPKWSNPRIYPFGGAYWTRTTLWLTLVNWIYNAFVQPNHSHVILEQHGCSRGSWEHPQPLDKRNTDRYLQAFHGINHMPNRYCISMDTRRVLEPVPRKLAVAFFSASSINMGHLEEFGEVISRWSGNSETFTISAFHLGSRRLMRNRTSGITLRLVESTRSPGSEYLRD